MRRKYPRGKGLPDPAGERAQRSLSYRLSKNSLFCADGVSGGFLLLTDLSPLRAKILRFLVGIKKILFFPTITTSAPPRKLGGPRWLRVPPLAGCAWRAQPYGGSVVRQHGKPRSGKRSHADPAGADQAQGTALVRPQGRHHGGRQRAFRGRAAAQQPPRTAMEGQSA